MMIAAIRNAFSKLGRAFPASLFVGCLAAALLAPSTAHAWWSGDWSYRKKITIDVGPMGAAIPDDAGRIPVLVRLHDGNFKFTDAKEDGSDIRFVDGDDKTPLKFHIDTYDGALGIALIWVDVPALKAGATSEAYLYYGNAKTPPAADARGTYDADTTLVYHFSDRDAPPRDETAYNNAGQPAVASVESSFIGRGARFDGAKIVTLPASPALAIAQGGQMTWSAWVKPDAPQPSAVLYAKRSGASALIIGLDQNAPYVSVINNGAVARSTPVAPLLPAWHHIAVTAAAQITLFVDGKAVATLAAALPALTGAATLGGDPAQAPVAPAPAGRGALPAVAPVSALGFAGELDELEISKVARSAGFIAASFASQGPDGKMLAFGEDEENAGWSGGYFGIILKQVTIDGWVVIGILSIMAAISWVVMWSKSRYIGQVSRANALFLESFARADSDIARFASTLTPNNAAKLEASILYRVADAGRSELARRMEGTRAQRLSLSTQAIATIRANLDRIMAYEEQRLNSLMVLLTIAISGGPFLGLLGTVVGVMITFAAIAATGDVNINAIAPGIAAALVATVVGLGVAIPALFGYNYLITRIKDMIVEMHVFADEYVTRLAEAYPPYEPRMAAE